MVSKHMQLTGRNLCDMECVDKNSIIHPETCVNQLLISDGSPKTLSDWFAEDTESAEGIDNYTGLLDWLDTNYPIDITLPVATDTTLGILKVDTSDNILNINEGILSFNREALDIPVIDNATISNSGTIKLGNSTQLNTALVDYSISGQIQDSYSYDEHNGHVFAFPLRVDSENRAAVTIPTKLFTGNSSITLPDWTLDWSRKVPNVNITTSLSGTDTNYLLIGNKNINTSNGELGYDDQGNISTDYGYPRMALVAGNGINFKRYINTFISDADRVWNSDITEVVVSSNIASSDSLGGIKIGYVKEDNKKPVQLDNNNRAYVDTEQHPMVGGVITNGLHAMFFRPKDVNLPDECYIPIIKSSFYNQDKMSVVFEIFGREDGKTYYGKYYINCMKDDPVYADLICLGFYTNSSLFTDPSDIQMLISDDGNIYIYKKEYVSTDDMFIVNVLSENDNDYSIQEYYTTENDVPDTITLVSDDGISYADWNDIPSGDKITPVNICEWTTPVSN